MCQICDLYIEKVFGTNGEEKEAFHSLSYYFIFFLFSVELFLMCQICDLYIEQVILWLACPIICSKFSYYSQISLLCLQSFIVSFYFLAGVAKLGSTRVTTPLLEYLRKRREERKLNIAVSTTSLFTLPLLLIKICRYFYHYLVIYSI